MRRLARHAFTALSALSLVLCVAVCVLWVRSYWVRDTWAEIHGTTQRHVASDAGRIEYAHICWRQPIGPDIDWTWSTNFPPGTFQPIARQMGYRGRFGVGLNVPGQMAGFAPPNSLVSREWWVPHWLVAAVLAIPAVPAGWTLVRCVRQRVRRRGGLCARCGYDLRASPDRCPECGTPVRPGSPQALRPGSGQAAATRETA